jgi:NitT/TauT family transport system substrate-binding protein
MAARMDMRCKWFSGLALALTLALAAGCDRNKSGKAAKPLEEVRIGYFANLTHAQAVLGTSSGEFGKAVAPAKLTTRVFNAGPSLIEALFAGQIDIGYVGPGPALNAQARSHGQGIRIIAGAAANGVLIVARKDSGIKTLADLKGRKIATPQLGNTQDISAKHFMMSEFGQTDVKNIVSIANAEQLGLMVRGEIDAAWAPEPWGSRLVIEAGATPVGEEKDLWPGKEFTLTVVVTTPEFLRDHADVVEKVLGVHHAWTQRLTSNPTACVEQLDQALFALNGKRLPPGTLPMAITRVKFTDNPVDQTLQSMAQWANELGFSPEPAQLDNLVDLTILKKLQAK